MKNSTKSTQPPLNMSPLGYPLSLRVRTSFMNGPLQRRRLGAQRREPHNVREVDGHVVEALRVHALALLKERESFQLLIRTLVCKDHLRECSHKSKKVSELVFQLFSFPIIV